MKKHSFWITGLLVAVFSLVSQGVWAFGHSTHYGKVTVTSTANGSVYIGTTSTATSGNTTETWNCEGDANNDSKTFYLFAKPDDGYGFAGWSGADTSTDNPYQVTVTATSTNSGNPTTKSYTATFAKLKGSVMQVTAVGNGTVAVSTTNSTPADSEFGTTKQAQAELSGLAENTYYLFAKAEDGYVFSGWYTTSDCSGEAESKEESFTATAPAGEDNPVTNYYAKFVPEGDYSGPDNWMKQLDDDVYVSQVSIPGAHDAGTGYGLPTSTGETYSRTQGNNILDQWDAGIRAFDLRPRANGSNVLMIYHGTTVTNVSFDKTLEDITSKLKARPSEFAVVVIRHELDNPSDAQRTTWEGLMKTAMEKYKDFLIEFRADLTVGDVRGKIIVLSRNEYTDGKNYGAFVYGWNEAESIDGMLGGRIQGKNSGTNMYLQDVYKTNNKEALKTQLVEQMLDKAIERSNINCNTWVINHTSGYNDALISSASGYRANAKKQNKAVIDYLASHSGPIGIIVMDYAGVDTYSGTDTYGVQCATAIIENNFKYEGVKATTTMYEDGNLYVATRGRELPWTAKYKRLEGPQHPGGEDANAANALDNITLPSGWNTVGFDDSAWETMKFPIASQGTAAPYYTNWDGTYNTMLIRREFDIDDFSLLNLYKFRTWHDDDLKVYINGNEFYSIGGWSGMGLNDYREVEIPSQYLHAGKNILAIEVQQNWGGAYFDCGVLEVKGKPEVGDLSADCILPSTEFDGSKSWNAATWVALSDGGFGEWSKENANFCKIMGTPADVDGKKWYASDYEVGTGWELHSAAFSDNGSYKWAPDGKFGDIYFRREFTTTGTMPEAVYMSAGHDDAPCEYYLNGELIWKEEGPQRNEGWYTGEVVKLTEAQKALIKTDGSVNVLAVHVHQNWGGYRADVGLYSGGTPKTNYENSRKALEERIAELNYDLFNNELNPVIQKALEAQSIRDNQDALAAINALKQTDLKAKLQLFDTDWHSFVAPEYNVAFTSTDVEAYKVVQVIEGDKTFVKLERVNEIEANDAVVVRSDNGAGLYGIPVITREPEDDLGDNIFKAATEAFTVTEDDAIYCLSVKNGKAAFYPVKVGVAVPAYKGYLDLKSLSARPLLIEIEASEGDATGIVNVGERDNDNQAIYNIAGQRVQTVQKGLYIVNGKKILVK